MVKTHHRLIVLHVWKSINKSIIKMEKTKIILRMGKSSKFVQKEVYQDILPGKFTFKDFKDIFKPDELDRFFYYFEYYDDTLG